jgi:hypothetical protein
MTRQYYPDQPHISPIKTDNDGNCYELDHEYSFYQDGIDILVFKGFKYDGASVPRFAWTLSGMQQDGLWRSAALIHDILYLQNGMPTKMLKSSYYKVRFKNKLTITRKEADKIFYKIMRENGVGKTRAWLAYKAVRIGGRFIRDF